MSVQHSHHDWMIVFSFLRHDICILCENPHAQSVLMYVCEHEITYCLSFASYLQEKMRCTTASELIIMWDVQFHGGSP